MSHGKRYRGKYKFYHQTSPDRVESILNDGLLMKYSRHSYKDEYACLEKFMFLSKGQPFYIPGYEWDWWSDSLFVNGNFYKMVDLPCFEVDVRGIRDYNLFYDCMYVYEDIPPERLRVLPWQELEDLIQRSFTT